MTNLNYKKEIDMILSSPRCKYGFLPKIMFVTMDIIAGKKTSIPKAMLLEMLASIPYRKWESKFYKKLSFGYKKKELIDDAYSLVNWGREAQDNEYWHLVVLNERFKELGLKSPWYLSPFFTCIVLHSYMLFSCILAKLSIRYALSFNAQFEDHAMHTYAEYVKDNPELEKETIKNDLVKQYADLPTWADVLSRIAVDELEHKENSLKFLKS